MNKIEIKNLSKNYYKDNKKICVLNNANYTFYKKKFYVIMGKSGSGKSTLLNIIAGLVDKDKGEVLFDNQNIHDSSVYAKVRNKNLGLVYQSFLLHNYLTALENVMLPLFISKKSSDAKKIALKKLNDLSLADRYAHYPLELSGGEQQRVAIARALVNAPDFILADEPTGNLDEKNETFLFNYFKDLAHKNNDGVIVVSHNNSIKKYADVVLILENGELHEE